MTRQLLAELHYLQTAGYLDRGLMYEDHLRAALSLSGLEAGFLAEAGRDGYVIAASAGPSSFPRPGDIVRRGFEPDTIDISFLPRGWDAFCATPVPMDGNSHGILFVAGPQFTNINAGDCRKLLELLARGVSIYYFEGRIREERAKTATDQLELTLQLAYQAQHDPLTSLPNRASMQGVLSRAVDRARERGRALAVLAIDIDRLRIINETLGHSTGDALLVQVADRLAAQSRPSDNLARMGGDEFALVLQDLSTPESAIDMAKRLVQAIRKPFRVDARELFLTASIGISLYPRDGVDPQTLLMKADAALGIAKQQGMDNAQFYQQASVRPKSAYLELETELRRALDQGELRLFYQPEVRSNGSLDSFEVLLVWENPRRGRTSAAHFISIAEDSGMIIPIGEWVLNEACRQCAAWRKLYPHARLAVNVSALQFTHHRFLEMVEGALERAGLPGSALELELTESCILSDVTESARRMQRLRSMGVQLSIDDFGTGYSSLSYLRKLPVNGLKIDKSFLREVGSSPSSVSMVNTIVSLAKSMGLFVVGEGVETYEQLDLLRSAGCDRLQGHLFGAPMPADAAAQFLAMPAPVSPVFSAQ